MEGDNLSREPSQPVNRVDETYGFVPAGTAEINELLEKSLGSASAAQMLESRSAAESYLTNPETKFRVAAIIALAHHWGPDDFFRTACEHLTLLDPDPIVRRCALATFDVCYRATDRVRVGKVAAVLAYDSSQPHDVRFHAYRTLFHLHLPGANMVLPPRRPDSPDFRFPEDADWRMVDGFLYPEETKGSGVVFDMDGHF